MEIKPEEKFMDIMQELIDDASIELIEVNYYNTGGCYVTAHAGADYVKVKSYEFYKPANKSNRLSGEMGYLESHNAIEVRRSKLYARDTYEIIKNAPVDTSAEKTYFEKRYISKYQNTTDPVENILEAFEYELSQPEVTYITFDNSDPKYPYMFVETGTPTGPNVYAGFRIYFDSKNYDETIRFIVRNSEFFAKKYSIEFVSHLCKEIEKTPIRLSRSESYRNTVVSQKKPVSDEPVFRTLEDMLIMGINGVQEFIEYQMDNDDVDLIQLEKMEDTGAEKAIITLRSGAKVEFALTVGDFAKAEEFTEKNNARIEAEGYWVLGQTQFGGGNRQLLKIRAFPLLENSDDDNSEFKVIKNAKRFLLNELQNSSVSRFVAFAPEKGTRKGWAGEIRSNDSRVSYDMDISEEAFLALGEIMEGQKEELEKKFHSSITVYHNEIRIEKEHRIDYRNLVKKGFLNDEMFDFLSMAYRAGCNIVIQGLSGSGKTTFLRALYEGANDGKVTALLDGENQLLFSDTVDNFISLRGSGKNVTQTALAISPPRVVMDFRQRNSHNADFMEKCVQKEIQIISSLSGSLERMQNWKANFAVPFEISVELSEWKVKSINQLTVSGQHVDHHILWKQENNEFIQVNTPTRSLRRKIEQNLDKEAKKPVEAKDSSILSPMNPLVTISQEEKQELMDAMKTIQKFIDKF